MPHAHCAKRCLRPHGEFAAITQDSVKLNLRQISRRVDHAGNPVAAQVLRSVAQKSQLFVLSKEFLQRPLHHRHGGFHQHAAGMPAGVAHNALLFVRISDRLVGDAGQLKRLSVHPQRVLRGVMHDHRAVRNRAIQQFMSRRGGRRGAEVHARDQHFAIRPGSRVFLEFPHQFFGRVVRRNRSLRSGKIQPVQLQTAEPHVRVIVREIREPRFDPEDR